MTNENGIATIWTPELEASFQERIDTAPNFAAKHFAMTLRDLLKFDHRSKAFRRALAQAQLRMATLTDKECEQLAVLRSFLPGKTRDMLIDEATRKVKELRDRVIIAGINKEELEVH